MTFAQLIDAVAWRCGISKLLARGVVEAATEIIGKNARLGARVPVPGLGVFSRRTMKARVIRNPSTKKLMRLPAVESVGFRASKHLKRKRRGK